MFKRKRIQGPDFTKLEDKLSKFLNAKWKSSLSSTCFEIIEHHVENWENWDQEKYDIALALLSNLQVELDVRVFELCERIISTVLINFNHMGRVDIRGLWMQSLIKRIANIYVEQIFAMDSFFGYELDIDLAHSFFPNVQTLKDKFENFVNKYDRTLDQPYIISDEIELIHELLDIARETYITTVFKS